MTVPDFQSIMLPFLKIAGDGREHQLQRNGGNLGQTVYCPAKI